MTNPLGKIKDVAVGSIKAPVGVARTALGVATGAAGKAAGAATSLVGGRHESTDDAPEFPSAPAPTEAKAPEEEAPKVTITPDEPVNVTKELGLDPSPVAQRKPARKSAPKPTTRIDAAADPSSVDVTPAEVAEVVSKGGTPDATKQ